MKRERRSVLLFTIGAGIIFFIRYLFIVTTNFEERLTGGIHEPTRVQHISYEKDTLYIFVAPHNEYPENQRGWIFIFQNSLPHVKIEIKDDKFPFLFTWFIGPLYIYIPRALIFIFGENIYAVRLPLLLSFLMFVYIYTNFLVKIYGLRGILPSLFLILFSSFNMKFLMMNYWNATVVYTSFAIIVDRIYETFKRNVLPSDILIISFFGGIMLHFHLLEGGLLFFSIIISRLICMKNEIKNFIKANFLFVIAGFLIFIILVLPYAALFLPLLKKDMPFGFGRGSLLGLFFHTPFKGLISYIKGLFFSSFILGYIDGKANIGYLFFSLPVGFSLIFCLYFIIKNMMEDPFKRFGFLTILIFICLSAFSDVEFHHINSILLILTSFLLPSLNEIKAFSPQSRKRLIYLLVVFNFIQIELLRGDVINSTFSLFIHREVVKYAEEQNIKKIYDFAGRYSYTFISKKKIDVIDMWDYLISADQSRIALALIYARGNVIMVERFKSNYLTLGITPEMVYSVAERIGLSVKILKQFPNEKNPIIILMKVE